MLIAKGSVRTIGKHEVLTIPGRAVQVLPFWSPDDVKQLIHSIEEFLKNHRETTVVGGVLLLALGFWAVRLIAACALGAGLLACVWFGLTLCGLEGLLNIPDGSIATWALAALGFVVGTAVALQPGAVIGAAAVRLTLALLCLAFADGMAETFAWPPQVVTILGVAGSVLAPPLGLAFLAAHLLAMGLGAQGVGLYIVLCLTLVSVHVMTGGRWIPTPARRRPTRTRAAEKTSSIGINDLLPARGNTKHLETES
jgi:hypothetical protein